MLALNIIQNCVCGGQMKKYKKMYNQPTSENAFSTYIMYYGLNLTVKHLLICTYSILAEKKIAKFLAPSHIISQHILCSKKCLF